MFEKGYSKNTLEAVLVYTLMIESNVHLVHFITQEALGKTSFEEAITNWLRLALQLKPEAVADDVISTRQISDQ